MRRFRFMSGMFLMVSGWFLMGASGQGAGCGGEPPTCFGDRCGVPCAQPMTRCDDSANCTTPVDPQPCIPPQPPKPPTKSCRSDADCGHGEICERPMYIQTTRCAATEDGQTRCGGAAPSPTPAPLNGQCVKRPKRPKRPKRRLCRVDSDCRRGEQCAPSLNGLLRPPFRGICQPVPPPPPVMPCTADSDCEPSQRCQMDDEPVAPPKPLPVADGGGSTSTDGEECMPQPTGRCVPRTPQRRRCQANADCNANEICLKAPPTNEPVPMPMPAPRTGSTGSSSVDPNETPAVPPSTDGGSGEPTQPPMPPMPPADGYCAPKPPSNLNCITDADCKAGQRCEHFATCAAIGCPPPPPSICVDNAPVPSTGTKTEPNTQP